MDNKAETAGYLFGIVLGLIVQAAFWIAVIAAAISIAGCGEVAEKRSSVDPAPTSEAADRAAELNARRATWLDKDFVEHGHVCAYRESYASHGYWTPVDGEAAFVVVCDTRTDGFDCAVQWCERISAM
jgi:hypothetical protein